MTRIGLISFSEKGGRLAGRLAGEFQKRGFETEVCLSERHGLEGVTPFRDLAGVTGRFFAEKDILIFIGACGIAVRAIAPYIKNKLEDPGVLVADECGDYVISLLSGHLGGANMFTELTAGILGAVPVITTATDRNGVFAVDVWAARHFLRIMEPRMIREISSRLLAGEKVGLYSDLPIEGELPEGLVWQDKNKRQEEVRAGIAVSYDPKRASGYFSVTCHLLPMDLVVGMGCKKGKDFSKLHTFLCRILADNGLQPERVGLLCSIRGKEKEAGLLELAHAISVPFETWTAEELMEAKGSFESSDFVMAHMGADNICERSACLGSGGGRKLVGKQAENGMTAAVYQREIRPGF